MSLETFTIKLETFTFFAGTARFKFFFFLNFPLGRNVPRNRIFSELVFIGIPEKLFVERNCSSNLEHFIFLELPVEKTLQMGLHLIFRMIFLRNQKHFFRAYFLLRFVLLGKLSLGFEERYRAVGLSSRLCFLDSVIFPKVNGGKKRRFFFHYLVRRTQVDLFEEASQFLGITFQLLLEVFSIVFIGNLHSIIKNLLFLSLHYSSLLIKIKTLQKKRVFGDPISLRDNFKSQKKLSQRTCTEKKPFKKTQQS